MSEELDRRIAVEVMGEEEPLPVKLSGPLGRQMEYPSVKVVNWDDVWSWGENGWTHRWKPLPFSSVLEQALRAVDKHTCMTDELMFAMYDGSWVTWMDEHIQPEGRASTLPEAICNLLLALKEKA